MKRSTLVGFALALINLTFIIVAYGIFYYLRPAKQIYFQSVVAALFSIVPFFAICVLFSAVTSGQPLFRDRGEILSVLLAAFLFVPLVFVPLHYVTQGYLTSFGNILATWGFQLPTNPVCDSPCKTTGKS